jgi:long-chain acyl-CoA synthetase
MSGDTTTKAGPGHVLWRCLASGRGFGYNVGVIDQLHASWADLIKDGAPFAMTTIEVRGVKVRTFDAAPPNVRVLWEAASQHGDRTYLVYEDERYTYDEIAAQVRALAHHLRNEHGVGSGDRVAIAMRNYPEWVVSYWAIVSLGAAVVGMNAWWTGPEIEYALMDSMPKVLIADAERLTRTSPVLDAVRSAAPVAVIAVRPDSNAALPAGTMLWNDVVRSESAPPALPDAVIDPDDDACIFYTSGTTGFPKGAQLTHRGCVHNLMHLGFWAAAATAAAARAIGTPPAPTTMPVAPPVIMAPTPLFHVTANNCLLYPATAGGGTLVLTYKWDPARALELIERERVTNFSGVPTMSRELLSHPDWQTRDTSSLLGMGGGGAALQPDLVAKIEKSLRGGSPSTGYGLTETHGIVTANAAAFFLAKPDSCGPVMPTFDARLVDENGVDVPAGEQGQLCVRGPAVIKGYLNRTDATAESIRDGWFNTGDVARIDHDGFVYIVDRVKDMVLRGGENVYCSEVETAIYAHGGVAEVAVFGIPDERLGEEVAAAVVLAPDAQLSDEELRSFLAGRLAKHKIPARIWMLNAPLPRNANGKFVKRELRKQLLGE